MCRGKRREKNCIYLLIGQHGRIDQKDIFLPSALLASDDYFCLLASSTPLSVDGVDCVSCAPLRGFLNVVIELTRSLNSLVKSSQPFSTLSRNSFVSASNWRLCSSVISRERPTLTISLLELAANSAGDRIPVTKEKAAVASPNVPRQRTVPQPNARNPSEKDCTLCLNGCASFSLVITRRTPYKAPSETTPTLERRNVDKDTISFEFVLIAPSLPLPLPLPLLLLVLLELLGLLELLLSPLPIASIRRFDLPNLRMDLSAVFASLPELLSCTGAGGAINCCCLVFLLFRKNAA